MTQHFQALQIVCLIKCIYIHIDSDVIHVVRNTLHATRYT